MELLYTRDLHLSSTAIVVAPFVTDSRLDIGGSLDGTVSTHEFEGAIFGFEFSNRAFELSDTDSGDSIAQIQFHRDCEADTPTLEAGEEADSR